MPKTPVHLHGSLVRFGGPFHLEIMTPIEAVRALCQIDGFREAILEGEFRVAVGGRDADLDRVRMTLGKADRIDIHPVAAGGKREGVGKAVLGAALMVAAFSLAGPAVPGVAASGLGAPAFEAASIGLTISYGHIALFGASTLLGGLIQALTPMPAIGDLTQFESADQRPSFLFNGPVNTTEQGGPVPWIFGRCWVGCRVVSAGLTAERI